MQGIGGNIVRALCPGVYKEFEGGQARLVKSGFYGGRREDFGGGAGLLWHYDFPSMYGAIMLEEYPCFFSEPTGPLSGGVEPGFYDIDFSEGSIGGGFGGLPVRTPAGIGYSNSGRGVFWSEEISAHIGRGGVVNKIHDGVRASGFARVLQPIASSLLADRALGIKAAKQVLNSVYGNLASGPITTKSRLIHLRDVAPHIPDSTRFVCGSGLAIVETRLRSELSRASNTALAAIITSRARTKLLALMDAVRASGAVIVRVETDSILAKAGSGELASMGFREV